MKSALMAGLRNLRQDCVKGSALVFAPHQDDETLGCGGTIIRKRDAGLPVTCVFMTDGATSHRQFMAAVELSRLRREEALKALSILGLRNEDAHFLDFPDSRLDQFHDAAVLKVVSLLRRIQPEEVFVPYRADRTPDHEATFRIVMAAVRQAGQAVQINEYPVWFWNQWPWVSGALTFNRDGFKAAMQILFTLGGHKLLQEFSTGVFVKDVLERKRQALNEHRSQMAVLRPGTAWPTLSDVSDGQWLECFFQEFEIFRCHRCPAFAEC